MLKATKRTRQCALILMGAAALGSAAAQEVPNRLGELLMDPVFEDQYIDSLQRAIDDARDIAAPGQAPPDLSIQGLRADPDFEDALADRVLDIAEEYQRRDDDLLVGSDELQPRAPGRLLFQAEPFEPVNSVKPKPPVKPVLPITPVKPVKPIGPGGPVVIKFPILATTTKGTPTLECTTHEERSEPRGANGTGGTIPLAIKNAAANAKTAATAAGPLLLAMHRCPSKCPTKRGRVASVTSRGFRTVEDWAADKFYAALLPPVPRFHASGEGVVTAIFFCSKT